MSRYRRLYVPGGTYFFTVNLHNRRSRLLVDHIEVLRAVYRDVCERWSFETVAICVLPDHLHCIWNLPPSDADFSTRWRLIKSGFSRALSNDSEGEGRRRGERAVWQRRFWEHLIEDERDLAAHIDYIHFNPVKHGVVANIEDWPHSSWRRFHGDPRQEWKQPPSSLQVGEPSDDDM